MSYDEIHFCLHTANRYLWELLRQASLQILGLSQSSGDTISVLFKDILLHNLTQLSWLRNKIVILCYRLICSDSPVATSSYYCLLHLLPFSPAVIFHILILWLHYRGPWYSYYSHNHPWFINKYSVSENSILWQTLPLTTLIHHEADMDNLKEKEKTRLIMWCHPTQECEIISSKLECQS